MAGISIDPVAISIDLVAIIRELDDRCWQCNPHERYGVVNNRLLGPDDRREGSWIGADDNPRACGICDGKGYILSEAGKELLAWLERWR